MSTASQLFPTPIPPEVAVLATQFARWMGFIKELRHVSRRRRRDFLCYAAEDYQKVYQAVCSQCDACIEHFDGKQREFLEHVKCMLEPWTDLDAMGYSPKGILLDLYYQSQELHRTLTGFDARRERRARLIRNSAIAFLVLLLSLPLARVLRPRSEAMVQDLQRYEYQLMNYADRITDRDRIVLATFLVVTIGISSLYSSRQY